MPVHFAPKAARDIEEIADYIEAENPVAAHRFVSALRRGAYALQRRHDLA